MDAETEVANWALSSCYEMYCISVGSQQFSVSAVILLVFLSPLYKSGVCSESLCAQHEGLLHPNPSAAATQRQGCVSEITVIAGHE